MTTTYDLNALADKHVAAARTSPHGRSAHLLLREETLRQSVIALTAGEVLEEHNAPPAATLQILRGEVVLTAVSGDVTLTEGRLHALPQERHGLRAVTDAAVLLTAVND
ncbi:MULTISPECIES: cupin [Streptomyces]|jgi:quercetin dioxygenase-like cupin family protein|uniref:Cupin n=2 Tax=Streptomyces TaxID=1883 RepID=A0AAU1U8S7_9ACTN|nr:MULTISPECIES: cupin [unclassified Streptomyces]MCX4644505.1 cupin [Streptomyces sp. NBC_01446]MCX5325617.1 cupin [Streptomyces sp. NBC_00120]RFC73487.1 cupin [Streptomyces sp. AcE210]WSD97357.1 cupin [Streptomyces sp. NBC_01474]